MTQLATFFEALISYIELVWNFFLNIVTGLANLVAAVASASVMPTTLTTWIGGPIAASILGVTAFSVIKILVGRSNI